MATSSLGSKEDICIFYKILNYAHNSVLVKTADFGPKSPKSYPAIFAENFKQFGVLKCIGSLGCLNALAHQSALSLPRVF